MKTDIILYITYDGLTDPLGYSQVFRYLTNLKKPAASLVVLSFEKTKSETYKQNLEKVRAELEVHSIRWIALTYHKRPTIPATLFDIFHGVTRGLGLGVQHRIRIVHARSYVAGTMALFLKFICGCAFIFDMRGFWADEKRETSGSLWKESGTLYRLVKRLEKTLLRNADKIISLSEAARKPIATWVPDVDLSEKFEVISTCTDLNRFVPAKTEPSTNSPFVLGYVGAVGLWYDFDAAVRFFMALEKMLFPEKVHFLIVNSGEHETIRRTLNQYQIPLNSFTLRAAASDEVPGLLQQMRAVCFFIRPSFSKTASAPTKLGEILACGLPCVGNSGIGDMGEILQSNGVGIVVQDFTNTSLEVAARALLSMANDPEIRQKCRKVAESKFNLERALLRYEAIYKTLLANPQTHLNLTNHARL